MPLGPFHEIVSSGSTDDDIVVKIQFIIQKENKGGLAMQIQALIHLLGKCVTAHTIEKWITTYFPLMNPTSSTLVKFADVH